MSQITLSLGAVKPFGLVGLVLCAVLRARPWWSNWIQSRQNPSRTELNLDDHGNASTSDLRKRPSLFNFFSFASGV